MQAQQRKHRVVVLALDGVYPFELGIPSRILGAADGHYEILTCSVDGGPVQTNADFTVGVQHGPEALATADTVVVAPVASDRISAELPDGVAEALARIRPDARIVSICTAAFVLAAHAASWTAAGPPPTGRSPRRSAGCTRRSTSTRTSSSSTTTVC